jgi:hypothetical protein
MRKDLIEHSKWLSRTSVLGRIRSYELKELDKAIKAYEVSGLDNDLRKIRIALAAWKAKEGAGWKISKRNADGAFFELERRMDDTPAATTYTRDLAHSRIGLLYLFSQTQVEAGWFKVIVESGFEVAGAVVGFNPLQDAMGNTGSNVAQGVVTGVSTISSQAFDMAPPPPRTTTPASFLDRVRAALMDFARMVWERITEKFKSDPTKTWIDKVEDWLPRIAKVVNVILGQVAASAAPFVGGAFDLASGIVATVRACRDRYQSYSLGQGVQMNTGHPAVIVASIERAMNFAIAKGLWDSLKGATSIATSAVAAGAGAIVSLVVSGCEVIAKVVHRLWETSKMKAFFADCGERYTAYTTAQAAGASDDAGLYHSGVAFGAWYRAAAYAIPCLSALALNSGITGDKMMYLRMFSDDSEGQVISQDSFDRGVAYVDNLKSWSRDYLVAAGYKFTSANKMVDSILTASTADKIPPLTVIKTDPKISAPDVIMTRLNGYNRSGLISLSQARAKFGGKATA